MNLLHVCSGLQQAAAEWTVFLVVCRPLLVEVCYSCLNPLFRTRESWIIKSHWSLRCSRQRQKSHTQLIHGDVKGMFGVVVMTLFSLDPGSLAVQRNHQCDELHQISTNPVTSRLTDSAPPNNLKVFINFQEAEKTNSCPEHMFCGFGSRALVGRLEAKTTFWRSSRIPTCAFTSITDSPAPLDSFQEHKLSPPLPLCWCLMLNLFVLMLKHSSMMVCDCQLNLV